MKPTAKMKELQNEMPDAVIKYPPTRNCRYCKGTGKQPLKSYIYYQPEHTKRGYKPCVCLIEPNIGTTVDKFKKLRVQKYKRQVALLKARIKNET